MDDHSSLVKARDLLADADLVRDIREGLGAADAGDVTAHDEVVADLIASGRIKRG